MGDCVESLAEVLLGFFVWLGFVWFGYRCLAAACNSWTPENLDTG